MQGERRRASKHFGVAHEFVFKDDQPGLERLSEPLLFLGEHTDDEVAILDDVGIRAAHHIDGGLDQTGHDESLGAQ